MFNLHVLHVSLVQTPQVSLFSGHRFSPFSYQILQVLAEKSWRNVLHQFWIIHDHIMLYHTAFFLNSVATLGVLTARVKARCSFEVVSGVSGNLGDPYRRNSFMSRFPRKSHTKWRLRRSLFRRSRFTSSSAPCLFLAICPFCVAGVALSDILPGELL